MTSSPEEGVETDFCAKQREIFNFNSFRPPSSLEPSRPNVRPLGGDPNHDPLHVHFTRSFVEKPSAVPPPKPKFERRPTSGRGLLALPLHDLLDDSDDSDDGDISVQSLASSSDFEVSTVNEKKETAKNVEKKGIKFQDVKDGENKAAGVTASTKEAPSGGIPKQKKRASSEFLLNYSNRSEL